MEKCKENLKRKKWLELSDRIEKEKLQNKQENNECE